MLSLLTGLLGWAFNWLLGFIPSWLRTVASDAVIGVLQPLCMPIVHANWFPDVLARMSIRLQLQCVTRAAVRGAGVTRRGAGFGVGVTSALLWRPQGLP